MDKWEQLADDEVLQKTVSALQNNGIGAVVVGNGNEAREKVLELLPKGAEVMTMTSVTLDTLGVAKEINESGNYNAVRPSLMSMDRKTQGLEMQKLGAAPEWVVGSVHAVTQEGHVIIASNSGSQLPAYAYGSAHVVWVVGTQKIVNTDEEGMKRIYEHCLPLEDERSQKAYGVHSSVSKVLVINKENIPHRITMILVKEKLGF